MVRVLTVSVELVNRLTPGYARGAVVTAPTGRAQVDAAAAALTEADRRPKVSAAQARALAELAVRVREVFEATEAGDTDRAAELVNGLLLDTGARPQLDKSAAGWNLHFHAPDDTLAHGWAAGCAAGLALAIGSDLAGRLGVCAAPACDRVYVDQSRNGQRRFCSPRCQSRVKAATHRARTGGAR